MPSCSPPMGYFLCLEPLSFQIPALGPPLGMPPDLWPLTFTALHGSPSRYFARIRVRSPTREGADGRGEGVFPRAQLNPWTVSMEGETQEGRRFKQVITWERRFEVPG